MLHLLRRAAKTWVFKAIFALLIVSFAVWGIGDLSFGGASDRVAQVGGRRITVEAYGTALSREINSLSQRAGRQITVDEAAAAGIPQQLLARIVRDAALDEEAARLGLSADDANLRAAILASPSFQGLDGRFDPESYRFILDRLGFTVERFETDLRRSLARDAVAFGVRGGAVAAPGFAEAMIAAEFERRGVEVLRLALDALPAPAAPDEAALRAFHAETQGDWQAPETRAAVWIEIDPAALAREAEIAEEEIRAAYDAAADRYDLPERRVADRLAFPDAAAAEAARAAIEAGETGFAALLEARGLATADVTLGEVTRDQLAPELADAVFDAPDLGVVGPVETPLGPALIEVRAILPARVTPYADARDELRAELARDVAAVLAVEKAEAAADLLAAGATLAAIAEEARLPLRSAPALARDDAAAAPEAVRAEAFAAEPGEERDLVETEDGGWVLVRVDAVAPAAPLPYEAVAAEVAAAFEARARRAALAEVLTEAEAALAEGRSLPEVAAGIGGTLELLPPLRRVEALSLETIPAEAIAPLFAAPLPAEGAPRPVARAETPEGAVLAVLGPVIPADLGEPGAAAAVARVREVLAAQTGEDLFAYYAAAVQARIGATFDEAAVQRTLDALR